MIIKRLKMRILIS